jgi:hypothetical protein
MPKESGPNGMNRREFLKKSAMTAGGVLASGGILEAMTNTPQGNSQEMVLSGAGEKINYPEQFKPLSPEAKEVINALSEYQTSYTGGEELRKELQFAQKQELHIAISPEKVMQTKKSAWEKLKSIFPELANKEFSDETFFNALATELPTFLAQYGIFSKTFFLNLSMSAVGTKPAFRLKEAVVSFFEISKVEHDRVSQWGREMNRDLVHLRSALHMDGKAITDANSAVSAQVAYGNIILFTPAIENEFREKAKDLKPLADQIHDFSSRGGLANFGQKNLELTNLYNDAIQLSMVKIFERMRTPTLEEYKGEIIVHETRHLFDLEEGVAEKMLSFWKNAGPTNTDNTSSNQFLHMEINPHIAQLKYSPNRTYALWRLLRNTRDEAKSTISSEKFGVWIVGHIVGLISENPEKYGIKISKERRVSQFNQILSRLDALLDKPETFDSLLDHLINYHKQNLNEDIAGASFAELQGHFTETTDSSTNLYKIGIPAAVGAGIGLEVLRRRKNRIAQEKMDRQMKKKGPAKRGKK